MSLPRGSTKGSGKGFVIVNKDWGTNKQMDSIQNPGSSTIWREREIGHLAKDRADIRDLVV